jgi:hypothetical protein
MEECVLRKWMPPLPDKVNKHFFLQIIDITYYYYRYTLSIGLRVRYVRRDLIKFENSKIT